MPREPAQTRLPIGTTLTIACALALCVHSLQGAVYVVSTNADSGAGSLRQAIQRANTDGGGQVVFSNVTGTIKLASALPTIRGNTTITGPGATLLTISGGSTSRVFSVHGMVTLSGLTIANGRVAGATGAAGASSPDYNGRAGADGTNGLGGGIYNEGTNSVLDCTFLTNAVVGGSGGKGSGGAHLGGNGGGGGGGYGGAICNLDTLFLSNCVFTGNSAVGGDGGAGGAGPALGPGYGGAGGGGAGAALYNGPAATATLIACSFDRNTVRAGSSAGGAPFDNFDGHDGTFGGPAEGGAICNLGNSVLFACTFSTNTVTGGAGGKGGDANGHQGGKGGAGGAAHGGGLYNDGFVAMTNCTFRGGASLGGAGGAGGSGVGLGPGTGGPGGVSAGGALYTTPPALTVAVGCTFNANTAKAGNSAGGAPYDGFNGRPGAAGSGAAGGAIANLGTNAFLNCTFYGNKVTGGAGGQGGTANGHNGGDGGPGGDASGGSLHNLGMVGVVNCTFAGSTATGGTGGTGGTGAVRSGAAGASGAASGANLASMSGTFALRNSILAYPTNAPNASGTFRDQGGNLSSDDTPRFAEVSSNNQLDPKLAALADNGGSTQTALPLPGSPAIDGGASEGAPDTDQRGVPRPQRWGVDIGAVETVTAAPLLVGPLGADRSGFSLMIFYDSSRGYSVQGATNLRAWADLTNYSTGGSRRFLDPADATLGLRFYRTLTR